MSGESDRLSDKVSATGRTRYYKSQIDPHVGDEGYCTFRSRVIFVAVTFPSYGLPHADTYESIIRQLIRKIRYGHKNRNVIGVYVPADLARGQKDPIAYLVVICKNSVRLSAIKNCLKGIGKDIRLKEGTRKKVDSYIESAVNRARLIYPGHDDEFGPFKDGSFSELKKPGRKPKKKKQVEPNDSEIGTPVGNVVRLSDIEAAPSPAKRNILASRGTPGDGNEILGTN